jgi:DNA-binding beta-propeller fold protein YncE
VLRRIDRFLAPVTWVAAAFTVFALLIGPSLIGAKKEKATGAAAADPDGKALFVSNCGGCHTLARAGTGGSSGPNLDGAGDADAVAATVRSGQGAMPSFDGTLAGTEIDAVAAFVAGVQPAAATPAAGPGPVTQAFDTDEGPDGIAVSGSDVWVAAATAGTLQSFDASTGEPEGEPLDVGRQPDNPFVDGDEVWLVISGEDAVARVVDGEVTRIPVGDAPEDLAIAGDTVWVANAGDGTVTRVDRVSGQAAGEPIPVGGRPLGIAADGDAVWVTSNDEDTVIELDAVTGAPRGEPIRVGDRPRSVTVGGGSAWVANAGDSSVTRVRGRRTIRVGGNPRDLVFDDGNVWVANAADDTITRIDAASGDVVGDPIEVGDDPIGIAAGGGLLWATNFRDDTLSRVRLAG